MLIDISQKKLEQIWSYGANRHNLVLDLQGPTSFPTIEAHMTEKTRTNLLYIRLRIASYLMIHRFVVLESLSETSQKTKHGTQYGHLFPLMILG